MALNNNTDQCGFPVRDDNFPVPDSKSGEDVQSYIEPSSSSWNEQDLQGPPWMFTYPLPTSHTTPLTLDSPAIIQTPPGSDTTINPAILSFNSSPHINVESIPMSSTQSYDWPSFARKIFQELNIQGSFPCARWYQSGQNAKGEYTTYKMPKPLPRTEESLNMVVCESMSGHSVILKYPRLSTFGSLGGVSNTRNDEESVQKSFKADGMLVWLSAHSQAITDNASKGYKNVFTKIVENETTGESCVSRQTDRRYFREKPLKLLSLVASHICHTYRNDLGTLTIRDLEEYPEIMKELLLDGTRALLEEASKDERWGIVSTEGERTESASSGKKVCKVQKKKSGGGSGKKKK
ncbi:hypothetical protein I302_107106 [Kwoniella bestiolae CBS 10118]|uniref:Uncharacterized protein n=1 Tax=Kwoniella bestiolae CBS 10118 TaxID=1296100 RepID=A0A1B9FZH7_9TREE|nr:hypothetical protein I302_05629 [Kwoniella bestiolae CBS 10118]OCF24170.1 hypothetical protein I302_05629 [Kwoniella bestiolae CBS 10118]